jgi:hypothetical protein
MTNQRKTTKAEIKSVGLIIQENAKDIAIALIRSRQFTVSPDGTGNMNLALLAVGIAGAIACRSFQVAPRVIDEVERNISEEPED